MRVPTSVETIELFAKRVKPALPFLNYATKAKPVLVAGGVFIEGKFGDIDIWNCDHTGQPGVKEYWQSPLTGDREEASCVMVTDNAYTFEYKKIKVQFCKQKVEDLVDLVKTFDFGICRVGAEVEFLSEPCVRRFHESVDRFAALQYGFLNYLHSSAPGISLLRAVKYLNRLPELDIGMVRNDVVKIVIEMILKGVKDPESVFNPSLWSENLEGSYSKIPDLVTLIKRLQKLDTMGALAEQSL